MAHSISMVRQSVLGDKKYRLADVTISSYTASGEAVTPAEFNLANEIDFVIANNPLGYTLNYNYSTNKFRASRDNGTAADAILEEAAASENVGSFRVIVLGT